MRIISLVPSLTKTLFDLGLGEWIVGCTRFCVDPPKQTARIPKMGGTKDPQLDLIAAAKPTHILVNLEENRLEDIEKLKALAPVLETFPSHVSMVPSMLRAIGDFFSGHSTCLFKAKELAEQIQFKIQRQSGELGQSVADKSYLYLIWNDPLMVAGPKTYISSLWGLKGWKNAVQDVKESTAATVSRYPALTYEIVNTLKPQFLFLSSEPFPFRKRHAQAIQSYLQYKPHIIKIDGKLFSWHGSTTLEAMEYLDRISSHEDWWRPYLMT